jgi:N-acetylornithine carbamoyltransferase
MRDFLTLAAFEPEEIRELVVLAGRLEREPEPRALAGKILTLLFLNPSLRTLASSQAAMARLGGSSYVISPGQGTWQLETRPGAVMDGAAAEHIREAIPVLAGFGDALGVRSFARGVDLAAEVADAEFLSMAALSPKPVINLESAIAHPCQGLADWKTLDDLGIPARGGKLVLTWANHPKPLPLAVPATVVQMAAARGMEVAVLRPSAYALPAAVMARARAAADRSGGSVAETDDGAEALRGAHVVYAKSWASPIFYGEEGGGAEAALRAALGHWCVEEAWFRMAAPGARFMHCLPVRRNVVVRDQVLDGPRSAVVLQAHNRLPAMMAVLHRLLRREETR